MEEFDGNFTGYKKALLKEMNDNNVRFICFFSAIVWCELLILVMVSVLTIK